MEPIKIQSNGCSPGQIRLLKSFRSNESNEFEIVAKSAIQEGNVDLDYVYADLLDMTLLDEACCEGREDFVEILVKLGADVNKKNDAHQRGPIHFAAEAGHERIIEIILKNSKANPNLLVAEQTALHIAVRKCKKECVRVLLVNGGADPNILNSRGVTPIHIAANNGQREMVQLILTASKLPVSIDRYRDHNRLTTRDILREKMPDLELPSPINDDNYYENNESLDEESEFLKNVTKISDPGDIEESMNRAAQRNFSRVARELIAKKRVLFNGDGPRFDAAAKIAVELGYYNVLREILCDDSKLADKLLLPACQALGVPTMSGTSDRENCFRLIMEQPDVNVRCEDDKGNTPLHYAARVESIEAVGVLLRRSSYIGHRNVFGVPPLAHISSSVLSDYFDDCLQSCHERTDEYEINFDYSCLMPHSAKSSGENDEIIEIGEKNEINDNSEMEALSFIAQNKALNGLLKHPLLSSFLYLKWYLIRPILYANFIFYLIFCFLINSYILSMNYNAINSEDLPVDDVNSTSSTTTMASSLQHGLVKSLASIALVFLAIRESLQFFSSPRHYFSSFDNILEVTLIILGAWVIIGANPIIGTGVILLSAWELVLLMGQEPRMSTGIEMFKTVTVNFARFLFLYAFLIVAFALAFFTLFNNSKDAVNFPDPGHSLFKTIIMLTGEFDANDIPFVFHPILSRCIFVLFVFLIAIVLFNLLNGLAVSDTADILNRAELVSLISRTKLVSHAESILVKLTQRLCCCEISRSRLNNSLGFLARTSLLFPYYLPSQKIFVKPYESNRICLDARARKRIHCRKWSMDGLIVERAKQILSRRGQESEHETIMAQLRTIEPKLERLETIMNDIKLSLANNNVNSIDSKLDERDS